MLLSCYCADLCDSLLLHRKSSSWHTSLRIRKKSEKREKEGKKESKLENGYRKSREGLAVKVSVKVGHPFPLFLPAHYSSRKKERAREKDFQVSVCFFKDLKTIELIVLCLLSLVASKSKLYL